MKTLEEQAMASVAQRTVPADELPQWAKDHLHPNSGSTFTVTIVEQKARPRDALIQSIEAIRQSAEANGMTEADLDDILNG